MCSDEQVERYLQGLERKLMRKGNREKVFLTDEWLTRVLPAAGAYVVFEEDEVVYVGETGNLRRRMKDLRDSRNHSLRRNIGKQNMAHHKGFRKANTSRKFPRHIEKKVDHWIKTRITISTVETNLGRKELEERVYNKNKPKYNIRGPRRTP